MGPHEHSKPQVYQGLVAAKESAAIGLWVVFIQQLLVHPKAIFQRGNRRRPVSWPEVTDPALLKSYQIPQKRILVVTLPATSSLHLRASEVKHSLPIIRVKAFLSFWFSKAHSVRRLIVEGHRPPSLCTLSQPRLVAAQAPAGVGWVAVSTLFVSPADVPGLVRWSGCTCWFVTIC